MNRTKMRNILLASFIATSSYSSDELFEQSIENILDSDIELKAQVGTRDKSKNFLYSMSGVDVITSQQIEQSNQTKLTDILRYFVSGFNVVQSSVADGSDHINSFTLRGMSSDQILVLIDGKRMHTSSLFHEGSGVVSSGTAHVDLNTIPIISIKRIEILRDGAAAQYGSDAIAGVINIILKGANNKNKISAHIGQRKKQDGKTQQIDSFISIPLQYDGFTNISLTATNQQQTQRAGVDRRITPAIQTTHVGNPDLENYSLLLNTEIPNRNNDILYITTSENFRVSDSSAFFRTPDDTRVIYKDGFLPIIRGENYDYSFLIGYKQAINDFELDISNRYGYNKFIYSSYDTINYTLEEKSPTSFDLGSLNFIQNTTNFDMKTNFKDYTLASGLEYKYENYKINSGDIESYTGTGSQGFSGFRIENNVDASRDSYAGYIDFSGNLSKNLSTQVSLRHEKYSDFGETNDIKGSLGYMATDKLFLRGTASSGFRAPSLAQSYFSHTSTVISNNILSLKGIFEVSNPVSQSLCAKDLKAEKSDHLSLGGVYQFSKNSSFMFDYFYIKVDDRIMLSDKKEALTDQQKDIFSQYNVNQAAYLTNAIDTVTKGYDIKFNNKFYFENSSKLESILWFHYNDNKVINNTQNLSDSKIVKVEKSQPKTVVKLFNSFNISKYQYNLNINRFSEVYQSLGDTIYKFNPVVTVDFSINYHPKKDFMVSIGADNIFDEMPDKWEQSNPYLGYDGMLPYSNISPISYSGAYYYIKTSYRF